MSNKKQRIAVIGAGISGLASAYLLSRQNDVVLFEAGAYLGGHTNTVDVTLEGKTHPVDTGFLVYNRATYPNLIALFDELGVASYGTDMSFGVSIDEGRIEWAGSSLATVFAQPKNLFSPSFWRMLKDILRFNKSANDYLKQAQKMPLSLGELLEEKNYSAAFKDNYLLPMAAAIWSSSPQDIMKYPASTFIRFCLNHALLQVNNRPQWQTVQNGGRDYVQKIAATLHDVRLNCPVTKITRHSDGVTITSVAGIENFDAVICATHAPQTLAMLSDASAEEKAVLDKVQYQANCAVLHTDKNQLPQHPKVWSAWNYLSAKQQSGERPVCVTYWLNQLQRLPFKAPVMVTLNPIKAINPADIIDTFDYEHPVFDGAAIQAQKQLASIQGVNKVWFAGAWAGYGFHEDGLKSALQVVADFMVLPRWATLDKR